MTIKVLIIHPHQLICSVLATALRAEDDIQVVGYSTTAEVAKERLTEADVILVYADLPANGTDQLTRAAYEHRKDVQVVVMGLKERQSDKIIRYVESGASGIVLEEMTLDELVENLRAVADEKTILSPAVAAKLVARVSELSRLCDDQDWALDVIQNLTEREKEVLTHIGTGLSNKEISDLLSVEVGTVKNHVHSILKKLNVNSRYEAARLYRLNENQNNELSER